MKTERSRRSLQLGSRKTAQTSDDIRIVYFDVDNTLVGNESSSMPTERFLRAVKKLSQRMTLAIASARFAPKVEHILKTGYFQGISVLGNGAQLYDGMAQKLVQAWTLEPETIKAILAELSMFDVEHWLNDGGDDYFPGSDGAYYRQQNVWDRKSSLDTSHPCLYEQPYLVVAAGLSQAQKDEITPKVEAIDTQVQVLVVHETRHNDGHMTYDLLFLHERANKEQSLERALSMQQLTAHQMVMMGDGRNDEQAVRSAGIGVAMANSAQETLAAATHIAPNQWDDGAAIALEGLFSL